MLSELPQQESSPVELRELVKISVEILGHIIEQSVGIKLYRQIESIRKTMAALRDKDNKRTLSSLQTAFSKIEKMNISERRIIARSFALMLELMNSCENAYRSYRLDLHAQGQRRRQEISPKAPLRPVPNAIIYVLTAHPTEARAPENIAVFHLIQRQLILALDGIISSKELEFQLRHFLAMAWKTPIVRNHAPSVSDEAEHIYSTLLEKSILDSLLAASHEVVPVYIRTWVGGDKDGHSGVNEKVMRKSLSQSRTHLIKYVEFHLNEVVLTLKVLGLETLRSDVLKLSRSFSKFHAIKANDGLRIKGLRKRLTDVIRRYKKEFGSLHASLRQLQRLMHVFPGFVVPLELRESSDVLLSDQRERSGLAIDRMLKTLAGISRGGSPRWYVRGFIVSMTSSFAHLQIADQKVRRAFGKAKIPVIPLFEQANALKNAPVIVHKWLHDHRLGREIHKEWGNLCEMMVGYSDSAKESGVLASRLEIAEAMYNLESLCEAEGVQPLFFQGSGGSIDRGGGSIQDQTAWWARSALINYKVTIQGEMVERSLASPEITRGQIERIAKSVSDAMKQPKKPPHLAVVKDFASSVAIAYKRMINDSNFLECVEKATPYSNLSELHIGSRPSRRTNRLSIEGLRAIPWVLCWTQVRVLYPTWWGVGSSWRKLDRQTQEKLRDAFFEEPVFASYLRALGFTLGKIELSVWRLYLEQSGLDRKVLNEVFQMFEQEFTNALEMLQFISGEKNPLWFNNRLGASIRLRSPMIHPLNLLQILAMKDKDPILLRLTVTGISSGMLTTG